jgi:S-methylmethionine-dependent homocysteine/selenocysteine methylase
MTFLLDFNLFEHSKRIKRPLILDGAMGSLLEQQGLTTLDSSWSAKANLNYPEKIINIHKSYIEAGADIITTNTFRTNPLALQQVGIYNYKTFVKKAIELAFQAKANHPVLIAGSNAPAEDCYQKNRTATKKELELNHCNHIVTLIENRCHFILNETQSHFDEIKIICEFCYNEKIPYVISLYFDNNLKILSGENIEDVIKFILQFEPLAVGFNCIENSILEKILNRINLSYNWGFYLNLFSLRFRDLVEIEYSNIVKNKLVLNPSFIGACCGSNPEDIKSIKELLDGRNIL